MEDNKISFLNRDIHEFKKIAIYNPNKIVRKIIASLKKRTDMELSYYELDLNLAILKQIYELCFPSTKQYAHFKKISEKKPQKSHKEMISVCDNFSLQQIQISHRPIINALLKDTTLGPKLPVFTKLIAKRSGLKKRTISNYVRRGTAIIKKQISLKIVMQYKKQKVSPTYITKLLR